MLWLLISYYRYAKYVFHVNNLQSLQKKLHYIVAYVNWMNPFNAKKFAHMHFACQMLRIRVIIKIRVIHKFNSSKYIQLPLYVKSRKLLHSIYAFVHFVWSKLDLFLILTLILTVWSKIIVIKLYNDMGSNIAESKKLIIS